LFYWAFKHTPLLHVPLCVSWAFLVTSVQHVTCSDENWTFFVQNTLRDTVHTTQCGVFQFKVVSAYGRQSVRDRGMSPSKFWVGDTDTYYYYYYYYDCPPKWRNGNLKLLRAVSFSSVRKVIVLGQECTGILSSIMYMNLLKCWL